jgi:hypothetical protein
MIKYSVVSEKQDVGGDIIEIFSVVDDDGMPINDGHFTVESDANYVSEKMNTGKFGGDDVSNLCKLMDSWIIC